MKRNLILGLLCLSTAATAFGQGTIVLDNYNTFGPYITYGDGFTPANGVSGALGVQGADVVHGSWTVGLYYALGNVTGSIAADSTRIADPLTLSGGLLTLGTGTGSTAGINDIRTPAQPGAFLAGPDFVVPGTAVTGGNTVTLMLVAYNNSTYDQSTSRGHSAAFTITTTANTALQAAQVGAVMPAFSVFTMPEPSMLALSGIGAAVMMLFRRKK